MGARRKSREIAMQILYSVDICKLEKEEAVNAFLSKYKNASNKDILDFAKVLIDGTIDNLEIIDEAISSVVKNWDIKRIASVDRAILRLSCFEIFFMQETPINVIINEAVEIAKLFSTDDSGKFVNGVIDRMKDKRGIYEKS